MFRQNRKTKAQSFMEYAVIIGAVAAALGAMGILFKAALQKRIYTLAQEVNSGAYAPERTTSSSTASADSQVSETYSSGISTVNSSETTARSSNETVTYETQ